MQHGVDLQTFGHFTASTLGDSASKLQYICNWVQVIARR